MLSDMKVIIQIDAWYRGFERDTKEINRFLKHGWVILDISKRGYDHTNDGENAEFMTVFVLGHTDVNAVNPYVQDQEKMKEMQRQHEAARKEKFANNDEDVEVK